MEERPATAGIEVGPWGSVRGGPSKDGGPAWRGPRTNTRRINRRRAMSGSSGSGPAVEAPRWADLWSRGESPVESGCGAGRRLRGDHRGPEFEFKAALERTNGGEGTRERAVTMRIIVQCRPEKI